MKTCAVAAILHGRMRTNAQIDRSFRGGKRVLWWVRDAVSDPHKLPSSLFPPERSYRIVAARASSHVTEYPDSDADSEA